MRRVIATTVLAMLTVPAQAQFMDGNKVHEMCQVPDGQVFKVFIGGYVAGLTDGARNPENGPATLCAPANATYGQLRDVVCLYVAQHPEIRHLVAPVVIRSAMRSAWACPR